MMAVLVLITALIFAVVVTPMVRNLAIRIGFVAVPKSDRAHTKTTPLMGGVALYIGFMGAILLLAFIIQIVTTAETTDPTLNFSELIIILVCGTVIAAVGLIDDWYTLPSYAKLGLQILPVLVLILVTDIRIEMPLPDIVNRGLSICWFLYVINAFNYTDNMDGIAGMIATVAGMFFTVITLINGQIMVAALAAAVAGTSAGFLRFNLFENERKIFMGDVGSLFLGFLLAVIGVKLTFPAESPWVTWPVPVIVLGIPIFDTALVFISRWRRGQSFLAGGTDHTSHRFKRLGFDRFGTPFAIGLLGSALGCAAIIIMNSSLEDSLAMQILVGCCGLYLLYRIEFAASYEFITGKSREQTSTSEEAENPILETEQT